MCVYYLLLNAAAIGVPPAPTECTARLTWYCSEFSRPSRILLATHDSLAGGATQAVQGSTNPAVNCTAPRTSYCSSSLLGPYFSASMNRAVCVRVGIPGCNNQSVCVYACVCVRVYASV